VSSAASKRARFSDRPVRNTLLAAASLVVVAAVALFVLGSEQPATVSFNLTSYSMPSHDVVVYGKVTDASNHGVSDADVVIYRVADSKERVLAQVSTSAKGLYRVVLKHLSLSTLYVHVSKRLNGRNYLGILRFRTHPGRACDVTARLWHRSSVFFLPVLSY
jgi:hypothetical protein